MRNRHRSKSPAPIVRASVVEYPRKRSHQPKSFFADAQAKIGRESVFDVQLWKQIQKEVANVIKEEVKGAVVGEFDICDVGMGAVILVPYGVSVNDSELSDLLPWGAEVRTEWNNKVVFVPLHYSSKVLDFVMFGFFGLGVFVSVTQFLLLLAAHFTANQKLA